MNAIHLVLALVLCPSYSLDKWFFRWSDLQPRAGARSPASYPIERSEQSATGVCQNIRALEYVRMSTQWKSQKSKRVKE